MSIVKTTGVQRFGSGDTSDSATFSGGVTAGNSILVLLGTYNGGGADDPSADPTIDSVTITRELDSDAGDTGKTARHLHFLKQNVAGGSGVVSLTGLGGLDGVWIAFEIDEVPTSGVHLGDAFNTLTDNGSPAITGTPTDEDFLAFAFSATRGASGTQNYSSTIATGFTNVFADTAQEVGGCVGHKLVEGSTANVTATFSCEPFSDNAVSIVFIKQEVAADPPAFDVAPTVTSQTASAYTAGFTVDSSCTIYGVAVLAGSATPSAAQIKAGQNAAGGAAIASANKAVTGADTLVLTPGGTVFPLYKLAFVLNNAEGDSSVVALADEYLDPPSGKQFVEVDDLTPPAGALSLLTMLSPAAALLDVLIVSATDQDANAVTVDGDGTVAIDADGETTRREVEYNRYDYSTGTYDGAALLYVNNPGPEQLSSIQSWLLQEGVNAPAFAFSDHFGHDEGDTLVYSLAAGAWPANITVDSSGDRSETAPSEAGSGSATLRVTDEAGDHIDVVVAWTVYEFLIVPNVVGLTQSAAENAIESAGFAPDPTLAFSVTVAAGVVISQDPAAGAELEPGGFVTIVVSLGPEEVISARVSTRHREVLLQTPFTVN